jgi:DNA-binding GntR family transcriptional regulator
VSRAIAVDGRPDSGPGLSRVYQRLRQAILNGEIPAGGVVSQVQLADQLGVSRTPLREALRLLEQEGLIEARPNRRVRVTPLSVADLEQVYALRISVESLATYISVPRLSAVDLAQLRQQLDEMTHFAEQQDYDGWHEPHQRFHACLLAQAPDRIRATISQLSDHAERYRRAYTTQVPMAWEIGINEHTRIWETAQAHDVDQTIGWLARHYTRVALNAVSLVAPEHDPSTVREALLLVLRQAGQAEVAYLTGATGQRSTEPARAPVVAT